MSRSSAVEADLQDLGHVLGHSSRLDPLSSGGPFEQFPGPVLVVARDGAVLSSNRAGEAVAVLLESEATPELRDAVKSALSGKTAQINPFLLAPRGGSDEIGQAVDLVALPWADGAAALLLGRDVSLERSLRSALIESRQRYKDLVEASSDFAWETDTDGRFSFVSPRGALGYPAATLVGEPVSGFLLDGEHPGISPFGTHVPVDHVEVWFRDAAGHAACLSANAQPLTGPDGSWRGVRGTCREITEERAREAELARGHHRERLLAYILRLVRDELEPRRMLLAAAEALLPALSATGVSIFCRQNEAAFDPVAEVGIQPNMDLRHLLVSQSGLQGPTPERDDSGAPLLIRVTRYREAANGALCLWRTAADAPWSADDMALVDELAAQIGVANQQLVREAELERLSATDPLTGLLNRRSFLDRLKRECGQIGGRDQGAALFYIDLDNFKLVNDHFGHAAGDKALGALAQILRHQTRSGDLAARLGGDEFGLFFGQMSAEQARKKGQALLQAAATLADYSADDAHPLGLSVGVAVLEPDSPENAQSLIARADAAMYTVKRGGKGGLELAPAKGRHEGP